MTDLIRRGDVAEILTDPAYPYEPQIERAILQLPAVDAVEVVRCKDCMWGIPHPASATVTCHIDSIRRKERAYCSSGEPRNGGEKDG